MCNEGRGEFIQDRYTLFIIECKAPTGSNRCRTLPSRPTSPRRNQKKKKRDLCVIRSFPCKDRIVWRRWRDGNSVGPMSAVVRFKITKRSSQESHAKLLQTPMSRLSFGQLFTIDTEDFYNDVVPTTPLSPNHPFSKFWQDFLSKLSNGCVPFWDAIMRIYTNRNQSETESFKATFLRNPPNIVIADMQSRTVYGRHKRLSHLSSFIFISKYIVNKWALVAPDSDGIRYEALLKATIVHEAAHWAQSLVSANEQVHHLPPTMKKEMTSKSFASAAGEAGYYLEIAVFGGIVTLQEGECEFFITIPLLHFPEEFSVVIVTLKTVENISDDALEKLKDLGLCLLVSPGASRPSPIPPHHQNTSTIMLRDSDDEESGVKDSEYLFPNHCPREYPSTKSPISNFLPTTNRSFHSIGCDCSNFFQESKNAYTVIS